MEGESIFNASDRESLEKLKFHFTYVDNSKPEHAVIFECDADDTSEADALYEKVIGKSPDIDNNIGRSQVRN